jgi:hypothetical protein
MISLQTLHKATAQEVFDQVASHLLTQKNKSQDEELSCRYRGNGGTSCAAGCLISDSEYNEIMEGQTWQTLVYNKRAPDAHMYLIDELQATHDKVAEGLWKLQLELVAKHNGLATTVLDKYND